LRANIALGGEGSGSTKIKYNHIEKSKQEGIFIVEGGLELIIASNIIEQNQKDGIVLLHSEGTIQSNKIQENERHGIYLLSDTSAKIESNTIMDNRKHGIDINDPSMPEIKRNKISGNKYNVWLDKNARKKWEQIRINNPEIKGPNYLP
jgi:parallel beta-helix repeat protein